MKLKTLKDLKTFDIDVEAFKLKLKEEAIKWVKKYLKEKSKTKQDEMVYWCYMGRIHALTEFHNITDEDLK